MPGRKGNLAVCFRQVNFDLSGGYVASICMVTGLDSVGTEVSGRRK
jgi:hypothetical protein